MDLTLKIDPSCHALSKALDLFKKTPRTSNRSSFSKGFLIFGLKTER